MTPTLIVVSGPPGSGKTTLAHELAAALGCPVISRDEIKQGMAQATPGFTGAPGDELTRRTFPVFFAVLELLLRSGVTTVAEAAFQDHLWRPELDKLRSLAEIRVVHCTVGEWPSPGSPGVSRTTRCGACTPPRAMRPGTRRRTARSAG